MIKWPFKKVIKLSDPSLKSDTFEAEIYRRASELHNRYTKFGLYPRDLGVWDEKHLRKLDVSLFRSDNVYVWQTRELNEVNYLVSYLAAKLLDKSNLFDSISESGEFGVEIYQFGEVNVSRDLLDSILEINFLIEIVGLEAFSKMKVLDIGAGYGRLAKNLARIFPEIKIGCVDSIPISTAISEFYLKDEISLSQVRVYSIDEIDKISYRSFDLVTNIHSFSEMSIDSVETWISFIRKLGVPNVFVIPNPKELRLNTGQDFEAIFNKYGYVVRQKMSKYPVGIEEKYLLYPSNYFYLELE